MSDRATVLIGAPGSGKSTIGPLLAARLGVDFLDVDSVIEARDGRSIAEIFADEGEPAFRAVEEAVTAELLQQPVVLALGGGAILSAATRAALRDHRVIWLQVNPSTAVQRIGLNTARPLLLGNVRGRLMSLLAERLPLYTECATEIVDTNDQRPEAVVESIMSSVGEGGRPPSPPAGRSSLALLASVSDVSEPTRIAVTAERPYEVLIGHGLIADLAASVPAGAQRVAVLHPPTLIHTAARVVTALRAAGFEPTRIDLPDAEAAKTAGIAAHCWSVLGTAGFTRSDAVIGLGGGATTDLAGFVAATWLRGVPLITAPTTLLGMVDAAVGGKTGINTPEGKNLVGCFYEPVTVVCDLDVLTGLPPADLVGGLAEVIKCGFIADPEILTLIEADPDAARDPASPVVRELVERSVAVKARVVSADLREATSTGSRVGRELLNYGHTLGHAIERREHYRWRHGEAVSVGMVFAAELARLAGRLDDDVARRHARILGSVGLPTTYAADAFDDLVVTMGLDKKTRGSRLRFVILNDLASAEILAGPDPALLRAAYAAVAPQPEWDDAGHERGLG